MANEHNISEIVRDVRVVLDQNRAEEGVLQVNTDTLELDDIIKQKILHAARTILESAPLWMFDKSSPGNFTHVVKIAEPLDDQQLPYSQDEPQRLQRPADFMRLLDARVVSVANDDGEPWEKPVTKFMMTDSEEYSIARSAFAGIKPNPRRPMLFYDIDKNMFLFYGCTKGACRITYVPMPATYQSGNTEKLGFPDVLYEALLYQTAALVETAYKNAQAAQMFTAIARGYMGVTEAEQQPKNTERR